LAKLDAVKDITDANLDAKVKAIGDERFYEDKYVMTPKDVAGPAIQSIGHYRKSFISTKIGNVDDELMTEMETQFTKIIKEEL